MLSSGGRVEAREAMLLAMGVWSVLRSLAIMSSIISSLYLSRDMANDETGLTWTT